MKIGRHSGVIVAAVFCFIFPKDIYSQTKPSSSQPFQTKALFNLTVKKSKVLKLGKSRLETQSAFVTYTNEFFAGKTKALKIQFFTQTIAERTRAKLLRGDKHELSRGGYAALVLFVDAQKQIWQVNLTYVISGITVVRTVTWTQEELARYFSDYHFEKNHLQLKSKGVYNTQPDSKDEQFTLSWNVDLNVPVIDEVK